MSSQAKEIIAFGLQSAFDTPATTADVIVVVEGKSEMMNEGTGADRTAHGSPWPIGEEQPVQHGRCTYPSAVVTRLNGVGNAFTSQMTESVAGGVQPAEASTCVNHRFTAPTAPKGVYHTIERYDERRTEGLINAVLSKFTLDMGNPQGADTKHMFTPEWLGSIVENKAAATSVLTAWATFISGLSRHGTADQAKIMHVTGNWISMGTTAAEIRTYLEKMTFEVDFNIDANAAKKAGRATARNMQMGMACTAVLTVEMEALTNEMEEWGMIGGDDETASAVPYRNTWVTPSAVTFGCWGPSIEKVLSAACTEVSVSGTPSNYPTPSGTYTGSATRTYHVEVQTAGSDPTAGTFKWWYVDDEGDGGATSSETEDVEMSSSPISLGDGISVAWQAAFEGCTVGDHWSFTAANYRYGFKVVMAKAQISVVKDVSGDREKNTVTIKPVADVGDSPFYIDFYTTDATAYDA